MVMRCGRLTRRRPPWQAQRLRASAADAIEPALATALSCGIFPTVRAIRSDASHSDAPAESATARHLLSRMDGGVRAVPSRLHLGDVEETIANMMNALPTAEAPAEPQQADPQDASLPSEPVGAALLVTVEQRIDFFQRVRDTAQAAAQPQSGGIRHRMVGVTSTAANPVVDYPLLSTIREEFFQTPDGLINADQAAIFNTIAPRLLQHLLRTRAEAWDINDDAAPDQDVVPMQLSTSPDHQRLVRALRDAQAAVDGASSPEVIRLFVGGAGPEDVANLASSRQSRPLRLVGGAPNIVLRLAPTGVAAMNIGGRTIHSSLPCKCAISVDLTWL